MDQPGLAFIVSTGLKHNMSDNHRPLHLCKYWHKVTLRFWVRASRGNRQIDESASADWKQAKPSASPCVRIVVASPVG